MDPKFLTLNSSYLTTEEEIRGPNELDNT